MTLKRMDNVLIVVDDLEAAKAFFIELGLKLEGETRVEGPSVGSLIGLKDVRATLAMMRTPDGQGIELDKFHTPKGDMPVTVGLFIEPGGIKASRDHRSFEYDTLSDQYARFLLEEI